MKIKKIKNRLSKFKFLPILIIALTAVTLFNTQKSHTATLNWKSSISNTYHNLGLVAQNMVDGKGMLALNNYGEVCVYCHTPHASNMTISAPIWNRTIKDTSYSMYESPTFDSPFIDSTKPGWASLVCLSCHDGTVAVDSIVNMPGSGKYKKSQETTVDLAVGGFLDQWSPDSEQHLGLRGAAEGGGCLNCHSKTGFEPGMAFETYALGVDLRDDHPIGMRYPNIKNFKPASTVYDPKFKQPTNYDATRGMYWFENGTVPLNNPNMGNDSDIKLWGNDATVQCASCHNPHGTLRSNAASTDDPTDTNQDILRPFLRMDNESSSLCNTCHIK